MGLIFTKGDLQEVGVELGKYKVGNAAYFLLHCRLLIPYIQGKGTNLKASNPSKAQKNLWEQKIC